MSWAAEEFKDIDLGDKRLDQRAVRLAEKPTASIPQACGGWAETQAAYRFLAPDERDWRDIRAPPWACSQARLREHRVGLGLQDSPELNFNGQALSGLGPLHDEAQRGMCLPLR
jgi:hypothetical protein